jgi:hypothetical protein
VPAAASTNRRPGPPTGTNFPLPPRPLAAAYSRVPAPEKKALTNDSTTHRDRAAENRPATDRQNPPTPASQQQPREINLIALRPELSLLMLTQSHGCLDGDWGPETIMNLSDQLPRP